VIVGGDGRGDLVPEVLDRRRPELPDDRLLDRARLAGGRAEALNLVDRGRVGRTRLDRRSRGPELVAAREDERGHLTPGREDRCREVRWRRLEVARIRACHERRWDRARSIAGPCCEK